MSEPDPSPQAEPVESPEPRKPIRRKRADALDDAADYLELPLLMFWGLLFGLPPAVIVIALLGDFSMLLAVPLAVLLFIGGFIVGALLFRFRWWIRGLFGSWFFD